MSSDVQQGTIRVRYWVDRERRGVRSSGIEFHGLNEAPPTVLAQIQRAVADELAYRDTAKDKIATPTAPTDGVISEPAVF